MIVEQVPIVIGNNSFGTELVLNLYNYFVNKQYYHMWSYLGTLSMIVTHKKVLYIRIMIVNNENVYITLSGSI